MSSCPKPMRSGQIIKAVRKIEWRVGDSREYISNHLPSEKERQKIEKAVNKDRSLYKRLSLETFGAVILVSCK